MHLFFILCLLCFLVCLNYKWLCINFIDLLHRFILLWVLLPTTDPLPLLVDSLPIYFALTPSCLVWNPLPSSFNSRIEGKDEVIKNSIKYKLQSFFLVNLLLFLDNISDLAFELFLLDVEWARQCYKESSFWLSHFILYFYRYLIVGNIVGVTKRGGVIHLPLK